MSKRGEGYGEKGKEERKRRGKMKRRREKKGERGPKKRLWEKILHGGCRSSGGGRGLDDEWSWRLCWPSSTMGDGTQSPRRVPSTWSGRPGA